MGELRDRMIQDMRVRDFAKSTQEAYVAAVYGLAKYYRKSPDTLTDDEIHRYLLYVRDERQLSASTRQQIRCGLRFFYEVTVKRPQPSLTVPVARVEQKLPEILSVQEVTRIIDATQTLRDRLLLMVTYGGGLRVSEAVQLRYSDLDYERGLIRVVQGKGKKDRYTLLPRRVSELIEVYRARSERVGELLFPGQRNIRRPIDITSAQKVYYAAKRAAGVTKEGGIHALRHAFATHLLEARCELATIQRLMGHAGISTTMRYVHVVGRSLTREASPLDHLRLSEPLPRR